MLVHACVLRVMMWWQVVRLLGVCTREQPLQMVMEFAELGSLKDLLRNSKPTAEGVLELLPGAGNHHTAALLSMCSRDGADGL